MEQECASNLCIVMQVLTGTVLNKRILIPRINLIYSGTILPFNLQRTQSPALAMTISLKDKHLKNWNIFESARFIHGQLHIAASRVRSLASDERVLLKKYRLQRSFLNL